MRRRARLIVLALGVLAGFAIWQGAGAMALGMLIGPSDRARGPAQPPADVRDVFDVTRGEVRIRAWLLDPPDGRTVRGTIVILHGIRDSKLGSLGSARAHVRRGYRVVIWDSRAHGESSGEYLTYGVEEARDLVALIDVLERKRLLAGPLYAIGTSYGGATVLHYAALDPRVRKVVAIAPFASLHEVVRSYLQWWFGRFADLVPDFWIDARLEQAGRVAGFRAEHACARCVAPQLTAAVLLIASRDDERIPYQQAEAIRDAIGGRARLFLVDGVGHVAVGRAAGVADAVARFLDE
jgi:pimeloyl-ACP methyl ester carboxylesterase